MFKEQRVAAVMPARNEQGTVGQVVAELRELRDMRGERLIDDIVVCDNGSTDATAAIARMSGARVVYQAQAGYGIACQTALAVLDSPDIVIFIDADRAFHTDQCRNLLQAIDRGAGLVLGTRTLGRQERGALPLPQRIGNRLACGLMRILWNARATDLGPFRAIHYQQLQALSMQDKAFGWTVEMQVKALLHGLTVVEIPVDTRCRESGRSKISGTIPGVLRAAHGILGTIFTLWWRHTVYRSPMINKKPLEQEVVK